MKPLMLTPEYEASVRADNARASKTGQVPSPESLPGQRAALLAEIDALRSLPVIRTCEDCSHAYPSSEHWACGHPYSPGAGDEIVRIDAAPPTDCPLRSVLREG